jgi:hypothetical protein
MASYREQQAFRTAAKRVANREISEQELRAIVDAYEKALGSTRDKAIRGIAKGLGESEQSVRDKCAASDDADRDMRDLQDVLDGK